MTTDLSRLPPLETAPRVERLRERFSEVDRGIEALLVTSLVNVRYLTGFTGSAAFVLVRPDEVVFVTDGRYGEQAAEELARAGVEARVEVATGAGQREALRAAAGPVRRLGVEAGAVTWAQQRTMASEWFPEAELVATSGLVESLRRVKDEAERARIAAACSIADAAFAALIPRLAECPTERDFALELEWEMRRRGAEAVSFDPIVAAGPHAALPHARPRERRLVPGELVVLDFGCRVDGYCSDMTRTVCIGEEPSAEARRMYEVVLESQAAGRAAVRDGVAAADVDRASRDVIAAAGWAEAFLHSTGHGVGLEIHEEPRVAATSRDTLSAGHVVTVEPGVYRTGVGGVRIEDTLVVTADGCEVLTHTPKDLVVAA